MAGRIAAAALQYSKKLSKFICWVWALYRFAVLLTTAIQPAIANAIVSSIPGIDTIMMMNVGCYLCNSLGEKIIYSDKFILRWLDKGGFQHLIGKLSSIITDDTSDENEEDIQNEENG